MHNQLFCRTFAAQNKREKGMKKYLFFFLALIAFMSVRAQLSSDNNAQSLLNNEDLFVETTDSLLLELDTSALTSDSATQSFVLPFAHPMPDIDSDSHRPMAPQATDCPVDSVIGYNSENQPATLTTYIYDDKYRTIQTAKWEWEEGTKRGITKTENTYNDNGKLISTSTWVWSDKTNDWIGSQKKDYTFDNNGKTTSNSTWVWSEELNDWIGSEKNDYTFDNAGNTTEWIISTWANNDWQGKKRYTYLFNQAGKPTETTEYNFDTNTLTWIGATQSTYIYNINNQTLLAQTAVWNTETSSWLPTSKYEYEYDEYQNQTLDSYYTAYNPETDTWTGSYKKIYLYNESKKKLLDEQYTWKNGEWAGSSKTEWEYNNAGKTTLILKYKWTNNEWVNSSKTVSEYNAKNAETNKEVYTWKNGEWVGSSKTTTSYNSNNKTDQKITYTWKDGEWVNKSLTGYVYTGSLVAEEYAATWNGTEWTYTTKKVTSYTNNNKADTITNYQYINDEWTPTTRTVNTYNQKVILIQTENDTYTDGAWKMTSMTRTDIEYDEAGHTILNAAYKCGSDTVWIGTDKEEWQYDAAGNMVYHAQATFTDDTWITTYEITWIYDQNNRKLEEKRLNNKNGTLYPGYWYLYSYDSKGREVVSIMYLGQNLDWVGSYKTERIYDENDQLQQEINYSWKTTDDTGDWVGVFRHTYIYDSQKRLTEDILERFNDTEWVNETRNIHVFNSRGLEIITNEYQWLNDEWTYRNRNERSYEDDDRLRTELVETYEENTLTSHSFNRYHYTCDIKYFTIRFLNYDGTILQQILLAEGQTPEYTGQTPTQPATAEYEYTFTGWDKEIVAVTADADYTAQFESNAITYTIRFLNYDGETLQELTLAYGETPEYTGQTPTQPATAEYEYTFTGWDKEIVAVTADADYTAQFESNLRVYSVRFLNYDGKVLEDDILAYGMMPEYSGDVPTREEDETYIYTFSGWSPELSMVVGDITYTAQFEATEKTPTGVIDTNADDNGQAYNLLGQPVDDNYNGIIIRNGKKELR